MRIHNLALPPAPPRPSSRSMLKLARLGVVQNTFCAQTFTWSAIALVQKVPDKKRKATYQSISEWQVYLCDNRIYDRYCEVQNLD